MDKGIIWLASYPKSGNTYTRTLLSNYFSGLSEPVSINSLIGDDLFNSRPVFEEFLGASVDDFDDLQLWQYRGKFLQWMLDASQEVQYLKTHNRFDTLASPEALTPLQDHMKVVYLVRNPVDVLLSYSYHRNRPLDDTINRMCQNGAKLYSERNPWQLTQLIGSWSENVSSWIDQDYLPISVIRYEDLKESPESYLKMILGMSIGDKDLDEECLQLSVKFSNIKQLQQQELKEGFVEKNPNAPSFFGRNNQMQSLLSQEHIERIIAAFSEQMQRLNYSIEVKDYLK